MPSIWRPVAGMARSYETLGGKLWIPASWQTRICATWIA